jgi:hypothetical protein
LLHSGTAVRGIGHDANDLEVSIRTGRAEPTADHLVAKVESLQEALVHDYDARRIGRIRLGELAAGEQRDADRAEETWTHHVDGDERVGIRGDVKSLYAPDESTAADERNLALATDVTPLAGASRFLVRRCTLRLVGAAARRDIERLSVSTGKIDARDVDQALGEQHRQDEQDERESELRRRQDAAERSHTARAARLPDRVDRDQSAADARGLDRGRETEQQDGYQRRARREQNDHRSQLDVDAPDERFGNHPNDDTEGDGCYGQAHGAADDRKQRRLREKLRHELPAARADRGTNHQLVQLARLRARATARDVACATSSTTSEAGGTESGRAKGPVTSLGHHERRAGRNGSCR